MRHVQYFIKLFQKISQNNNLKYPINIINIGGITNLTHVTDDNIIMSNLKAFDIGPGNCLIDEWVRNNSKFKFDENGIFQRGKINELIINQKKILILILMIFHLIPKILIYRLFKDYL